MYMIQNGLWLDDKLSGVAPLPPRQRPPIQPPSKEPFDVLGFCIGILCVGLVIGLIVFMLYVGR